MIGKRTPIGRKLSIQGPLNREFATDRTLHIVYTVHIGYMVSGIVQKLNYFTYIMINRK